MLSDASQKKISETTVRAKISRNKFGEAAIITGRQQSAKVAEKKKGRRE